MVEVKMVMVVCLLEIVLVGMVDLIFMFYNIIMYVMVGLLVLVFIVNLFVKFVWEKYYVENMYFELEFVWVS